MVDHHHTALEVQRAQPRVFRIKQINLRAARIKVHIFGRLHWSRLDDVKTTAASLEFAVELSQGAHVQHAMALQIGGQSDFHNAHAQGPTRSQVQRLWRLGRHTATKAVGGIGQTNCACRSGDGTRARHVQGAALRHITRIVDRHQLT